MKTKTVFYKDELNDDFAGTNIKQKYVGKDYKFIHKNIFFRIFSFLFFYFVAYPFVFLYTYLILGVKFKNKKAIRKLRQSCYLYMNHTCNLDAYILNVASFPRRTRIIASNDAVSIKGLKTIVELLGVIPVGSDLAAVRKSTEAVYYYNKHSNIAICPEAHIWPYYTKIRPFVDSSFGYPAKSGKPVIALCCCYKKRRGIFALLRKANITVYVSDPFYADKTKSITENKIMLRNKVYDFMTECSNKNNYVEVVRYEKLEDENIENTSIDNEEPLTQC